MAVLVRYFGLKEVEIAEDIVQDALMMAVEKWSAGSIPENPEGWLMNVAKKKAINLLRRDQVFRNKVAPNLGRSVDDFFKPDNDIEQDSTLRMIFTCCEPNLPNDSQIALALKTLCGLSVPEIASALLTTESNVNKRLYRAKQKFRDGSIQFEIPEKDLNERLGNVLKTLYLLFNEGYYSHHPEKKIRIDLCYEALRLLTQVRKSFPHSVESKALNALMLFSMARFESRIDEHGVMKILPEQDRSLWDFSLIAEGLILLNESTSSEEVNTYQLQAGIAAEHCIANTFESINWQSIYKQYQILENLDSGPIVKFNMCIAEFYSGSPLQAIENLLSLSNEAELKSNQHYYTALGIMHQHIDKVTEAISFFETALGLTDSVQEKELIRSRMRI